MKIKERIGKWIMEKEDKRRKRKSNGGLEKWKQEDRERGEQTTSESSSASVNGPGDLMNEAIVAEDEVAPEDNFDDDDIFEDDNLPDLV